jgi:hypothetical protein
MRIVHKAELPSLNTLYYHLRRMKVRCTLRADGDNWVIIRLA